MHALVALCAHAVALALEAPIAPAKLQWSRCSANGATTVALLRDTEVARAASRAFETGSSGGRDAASNRLSSQRGLESSLVAASNRLSSQVTTAQPMWPVGTAIETCLEAVDGDAALLCLPFSTFAARIVRRRRGRGDEGRGAAHTTWIFRGDESRSRRRT